MDEKLLALATPLFLLSILAEWLINRWYLRRSGQSSSTGGSGGYRLYDTVTDLACGIGQQLLDPLLRLVGVAAYAVVQTRWGLWQWDTSSPLHWALAMILVDLCFYVFHRASHRVRLLWAVHHVHHSSDEYNLAVALRQPWLEKIADLPFYLPLALLGMPTELYVSAFTLNLIYQFFLHCRWVPKLGALEWVLNTPSHHRVHHGVNPEYIDKNYGGMLVIWDRMGGTFAPEAEPVIYGTVSPLRTWNPWTVHTAPWRELLQASAQAPGALDRLRTWLGPPDWRPAALGGPLPPRAADPRLRGWPELALPKARRFAVAALVYVGVLLALLQQVQAQLGAPDLLLLAAAGLTLLAEAGAGLEARRGPRVLGVMATLALWVAVPTLLSGPGLAPARLGLPPSLQVVALIVWTAATLAVLALGQARDTPGPVAEPPEPANG